MSKTEISTENVGESVVRATGELSATTDNAIEAVKDTGIDQEQAQSWLTTIFKALFAALKGS